MNTPTQEQVKTKVPTKALVYISAALLFGGAVAAVILMNSGALKTSNKTSTVTTANVNASVTATTTTATANGIWISPAELAAIPITGEPGCLTGSACATAWNNLKSAACSTWEAPDLSVQTNRHPAYTVAGALVYARLGDTACTGTPSLRAKVRDGIIAGKRTMDDAIDYGKSGSRTLGVGRQVAGYVIAADLIDLPTVPLATGETLQADAEFRPWLSAIRDVELPNSNSLYGQSLRKTYENWSHNWSSYAGATMIAAALYLGETTAPNNYVARADSIFRSYGVRGVYPLDTWNGGTYFSETSAPNIKEWKCDTTNWLAISPACVKGPDADGDTGNVDGAFIYDVNRGIQSDASCSSAGQVGFFWNGGTEAMGFNCGMQYSWESIKALFSQAEMLHRAGYDVYNYNNQQLKRLMDFMVRVGWNLSHAGGKNPVWIANYRFGANYPTDSPLLTPDHSYGWTDWTHGVHRPAPSLDTAAPTGVGNVSPANGAASVAQPVILTAATATDTSTPVTYSFELYVGSVCTGTPLQTRVYGSATTWTPVALSSGTTYAWRNKARDNAVTPNESSFGSCWMFTTQTGGGGSPDPFETQ